MLDPFEEAKPHPAPDYWMAVSIVFPPEDSMFLELVNFLKERGFEDVDFCVMQRAKDLAQMDFAPCAPITENIYSLPD